MNSIRPFLAEIVDYAGLFPPAGLEMTAAVRNYARYRASDDRDLLGRFVVPAARLEEFTAAATELEAEVPADGTDGTDGAADSDRGEPWPISILVGDDVAAARRAVTQFCQRHGDPSAVVRAECDTIEVHARAESDVHTIRDAFSEVPRIFFEIPLEPDPGPMLQAILRDSGAAKIRTGGVTVGAFPTGASIIRFISRSNEIGVPFKATAGLHHAVRSTYPLTYDADSPQAMMFGYLNLFLAAAFVHRGISANHAREVLEERSAQAFTFSDGGVKWRGHVLTRTDLAETRSRIALSFGSCSFREPVDEARALNII